MKVQILKDFNDFHHENEKLKNQVRELQSQLEEMNDNNKEVITLLKNALEYYHNDKFANRAKSMKSFIDDALDILTK